MRYPADEAFLHEPTWRRMHVVHHPTQAQVGRQQVQAVVDGVAAQAAVRAEEVGAAEMDGPDGGQELAGAGALVAAGLAASTGAGGALFSAWSVCCCKTAIWTI